MRQVLRRTVELAVALGCCAVLAAALAACQLERLLEASAVSPPIVVRTTTTPLRIVDATIDAAVPISPTFTTFIIDARRELAVGNPVLVDIETAELQLGTGTDRSAAPHLAAVFAGGVEVGLRFDATGGEHPIASGVVAPDGANALALAVAFDEAAVADGEYAELLAGRFVIVLRGRATTSFVQYPIPTTGAELQVSLTFRAYE